MPLLTAAITVLSLNGGPGLPGGPYDHAPSSGGTRTYTADFTRLSAGTPGRPYGSFAGRDPGAGASRTFSDDFTRLGTDGVPSLRYGSFAGKSESTTDTKFSSHSIIPRITIGDVTDVDIDITHSLIPRVTMSSVIRRQLTVTHSLVPRVTMSRGAIASSSFNKPSSHSLVPKVTMAVTHVSKTWGVSHSIVPVVTMENLVDGPYDEILSDHSIIPVVTMSSSVDDIEQAKSAAHSLVPVVTMNVQVDRYEAVIPWTVTHTLIPRVSMSSVARVAGDVDRIEITASPCGYIEITKA